MGGQGCTAACCLNFHTDHLTDHPVCPLAPAILPRFIQQRCALTLGVSALQVLFDITSHCSVGLFGERHQLGDSEDRYFPSSAAAAAGFP